MPHHTVDSQGRQSSIRLTECPFLESIFTEPEEKGILYRIYADLLTFRPLIFRPVEGNGKGMLVLLMERNGNRYLRLVLRCRYQQPKNCSTSLFCTALIALHYSFTHGVGRRPFALNVKSWRFHSYVRKIS